MYDFGALVKKYRKDRKLTQKQLGDMLGITESTISKYESNIMYPPFEMLRSIAAIFNITIDELCGMKHQGSISTHGLSETQTETVKELIEVYRVRNSQTNKQLTQEQFAVLGKITSELTK